MDLKSICGLEWFLTNDQVWMPMVQFKLKPEVWYLNYNNLVWFISSDLGIQTSQNKLKPNKVLMI